MLNSVYSFDISKDAFTAAEINVKTKEIFFLGPKVCCYAVGDVLETKKTPRKICNKS